MTLKLRCVRCGELDEMDPAAVMWFGLCRACIARWYEWRDAGIPYLKRAMSFYRHRRSLESHPTYKALTAALEEMEAIPHGTLAEPLPSSES